MERRGRRKQLFPTWSRCKRGERKKEILGFLPRITTNKAARSENGASLERRNRIKARIAFPRSKSRPSTQRLHSSSQQTNSTRLVFHPLNSALAVTRCWMPALSQSVGQVYRVHIYTHTHIYIRTQACLHPLPLLSCAPFVSPLAFARDTRHRGTLQRR